MNSQYKKGVLELCVLSLLRGRDRYGYEISEYLSQHIDIAGGGVRVLLRIPAAAYALLRTIQEKRAGLGLRRGGAAPAAHQPAVFPESKTAAAYRGAGGAGTVCGVLRAGVLRVLPVGGKRAVLARVGLVCEMTSAEKTCKEIACGRFFCFWNNN